MSLFWLSFADDCGFRGGLLTEGSVSDIEAMIRETHRRGVNPGGQIKIVEVGTKGPFELWRLYSAADIDRLDKGLPWRGGPGVIVCETCGRECRGH